jgi:hypothetical protein
VVSQRRAGKPEPAWPACRENRTDTIEGDESDQDF